MICMLFDGPTFYRGGIIMRTTVFVRLLRTVIHQYCFIPAPYLKKFHTRIFLKIYTDVIFYS